MRLIVLGSSSHGNCYILDNGSDALIMEAGIAPKHVKLALGFDITKVKGCIITHRHGDHAKYIKDMVGMGFYTLALPDVWESKNLHDSKSRNIQIGKGYKFGDFKVLPFSATHDVPCVGYIVEHPGMGRLLFLTDSCSIEDSEYTLDKFDHIMIECNYSSAALIRAINEGRTMKSQRERLMLSHMELSECKQILSDMDLSRTKEIILLHLSDNNSDEQRFVSEVERVTAKPVFVAHPGMEMDL